MNLKNTPRIEIWRNTRWLLCPMALRKVFIIFAPIFLLSSTANANQQPKICSEIHDLLILRQRAHQPIGFDLEYNETSSAGDIYPHLDIDKDGVYDSIVRSCEASIDGICTLFIKLSNGKKFELEEEKFFLVNVKSNVYIVVGESLSEPEKYKLGTRRIYQITDKKIKLMCSKI
ncbi:hypothetical protein MTYM_01012 [Methylococcales bacterium]|nr:hypothetical protein MTYM_01012 [Methylococcales bacterium]